MAFANKARVKVIGDSAKPMGEKTLSSSSGVSGTNSYQPTRENLGQCNKICPLGIQADLSDFILQVSWNPINVLSSHPSLIKVHIILNMDTG